MLGPMELVDGASTVRLPRAERTLLAALASRVGKRVSVEVLEEALWPESPPPSARKTLQVYVVRLRHAVGASAIVERDGGYLLDPDVIAVDAARVARLVGEARAAIRFGDPDVAVGMLVEAGAAFYGEPYEGVSEVALPAGEAARLQELRSTVVEETFEAELACGRRGHQYVAELEAFVQANPYRERAWGLLMQALYKAGRPADALAAYGRVRMLLAAELGIEPGPALRDLEQAILTHDKQLLTSTATVLGRPNLPAALSPIIGRQLELATLDLLESADRLVTLVGVGGIGKTRLAIEVASQTVGRCACGPFFVDLAPIGDVELVPAALAATFGVDVEPGGDVMAAVRAALADHRIVVVVDNCEHLLPGIAGLVAALLASSSRIRVLATSREPLGIAGEQVCPVNPLRVPVSAASIDEIEGSGAGALFLARLPMNLAIGPLSPAELVAVVAICRRLEGIPLGLELAAARSRTLSLPELADLLEHSVDELAPPRHGVPARHRTMRAALDWGFELLTPPAQTALQAMSVFAGGCDLAAFTAVCVDGHAPPAVDVLDELVRTSFVTVEFAGERNRYRLLEPVRQHARQLLGDEATDRQRRHLDHYLALARSQTRDVDQLGLDTHVDVLGPELGNFRAALDWAAGNADGVDAGLWLVARLHDLWRDVHIEEGLSRTVTLLRCGGGSAAARSEAAYCAGFIALEMGESDRMVDLFGRALVEAQAGGDRIGEARARRVLSERAYSSGDIATARQHLETALAIAVDEGNDHLHALCVLALAQLLCAVGRLDEADERIDVVLAGPVGADAFIEVWAHSERARVLLERGEYPKARECNMRILELSESGSDLFVQFQAHADLARIERAVGNLDVAAAHIDCIEELNPDPASVYGDQYLAVARADLALLRGDHAAARTHIEQAVALTESKAEALVRCDVLRILGDTQLALDRPNDATATFQQLIGLAHPFPSRCAEGYEGAAAAAVALNRFHEARDYLATAREIRQHTRSHPVHRPTVEQHLVRLQPERQQDATVSDGTK